MPKASRDTHAAGIVGNAAKSQELFGVAIKLSLMVAASLNHHQIIHKLPTFLHDVYNGELSEPKDLGRSFKFR